MTKRPNPPKRPSTYQPSDQAALRAMLGMHFPDGARIVDVTYDRGGLWRGLRREYAPEEYRGDFLELPEEWTESWEVVVWDPPDITDSGASSIYARRFDTGNAGLRGHVDITHLYAPFLAEAKRVLRPQGLLLAKIADGVHRRDFRWQSFDFKAEVDRTPGLVACQLFIVGPTHSSTLRGHNWGRVFHGRRGYVSWFVVRKGRHC